MRFIIEELYTGVEIFRSGLGEMEGWLRLELVNPTNGDEKKTYHSNNNILSAIIRAKIPILSFEAEGGKLQDVFLHLTEETIK